MQEVRRRSAIVLGVCAVCAFAVLFVTAPTAIHAEYEESNKQCPAGGKVGQKCKDNTNGFVTDGHCTHINECTADKWSGEPSNDVSPKQPPGVPTDRYQQQPVDFSGSVSASGETAPSSGVSSGIINSAFSDQSPYEDGSGGSIYPENIVAIDGINYIIVGQEKLRFGDTLTAAPPSNDPGAPDRDGLGNVGGIGVEDRERGGAGSQSGTRVDDLGAFSNTFGAGNESSSHRASPFEGIFPFGEETIRYAAPPFGIGILALIAAAYLYFSKGKQMPLPESQVDPTELAKKLSTKDESVATPILTGVQEEPIWDTHYMPGDGENKASV